MKSTEKGLQITVWGAIANLLLFVIKISLGMLAQSRALIADAFHTLSDLASDGIVYFGLMFGNKKADQNHHFGHKKIETLAEMAAGILLMMTAIEFIRKAMIALQTETTAVPKSIAIVAALFSIVVKEGMFQWTLHVSRKIDSRILRVNAWHHRTDAFSSLAVLIGLLIIHWLPQWAFLDSLVGILLAFLIFWQGLKIFWDSFQRIIDTAPPEPYRQKILHQIQQVEHVCDVHNLRFRYIGDGIAVEMHVEVPADMRIKDAHQVADQIEALLYSEKKIIDVVVHLEPEGSR